MTKSDAKTPNPEIIELETEWIVSVQNAAGGWEFGGAFIDKDMAIENAQIFTNDGKRVRIEECPVNE